MYGQLRLRPHPAQRTVVPPIIVREKLGAPKQFSALSPSSPTFSAQSDWQLVEEGRREVANRLLFVSEGGKRQRNGKPKSASLVSPSRNDPPQMEEEENTVNVRGETPPASQRGASKWETLAWLKWHLWRSRGHGGPARSRVLR